MPRKNENSKQIYFESAVLDLIKTHSGLYKLSQEYSTQGPVFAFFFINILHDLVCRYSRTIKDLVKVFPEIVSLNPRVNFNAMVRIGDKLIRRNTHIGMDIINANIQLFFNNFIQNLPDFKFSSQLELPTLPESINDKIGLFQLEGQESPSEPFAPSAPIADVE
jgi:hypothetical protein